MKKVLFMFMVMVLVILSGCTRKIDTSLVGDDEAMADVSATDESTTDISIADEFVTTDEALIDQSSSEDTSDQNQPVDKWYLQQETNEVPFSPDGWDGPMVKVTRDYTTEEGITSEKEYEVAFLETELYSDDEYGKYGENGQHYDTMEVNGQELDGKILLVYEDMNFLVHETDEGKTYYFLHNEHLNAYYASIRAETETRFLIKSGAYLFVYDIEQKEAEEITDSCFSLKETNEGIFFIDWNHDENFCDWKNSSYSEKTGEKKFVYRNDDFTPVYLDEFQEDLEEIQESLKEGKNFQNPKYEVYFGSIFYGENYIGNVHLPKAMEWNSNIISDYGCDMAAIITEDKLTIYRYGEEIFSRDLPSGKWSIIHDYANYHRDANSTWVEYVIDTNDDGIESAEEYKQGITFNILLYKYDEKSVYGIYGNFLTKLCDDVQDYQEAYGCFYWMNSQYKAYKLDWLETDESVLIGEDAVGISKHTDEKAGFLVKPDDPRCNWNYLGEHICTMYGDGWLNSEHFN